MEQYTHCLKNEYTYKDITKPVNREYMSMLPVTVLGTQSGGFGSFQPHFKVVSEKGKADIRNELMSLCNCAGLNVNEAIAQSPVLCDLLK